VCFTDAEGNTWLRDATGELHAEKNDPFITLGIERPNEEWKTPRPA